MEIEHYFHEQHPLTFCEINDNGEFRCPGCEELSRLPHFCSRNESYSECIACNEKISGNFYVCTRCWHTPLFHKACLDLPKEIQIAYRSCCSLHFVPQSGRESFRYGILKCDFCNREHEAYKFLCDVCDFRLGFNCAKLLVKSQKGREHIKHFSHRHPLAQFEVVDDKNCKLCNERIDGTSYGCVPCEFYLHDSCRQLLEEIQSPLHPRHRLNMDLDEPKEREYQQRSVLPFVYSRHRLRPLIMDLDEPKEREYQCKVCSFDVRGPRYICVKCKFYLHPGCLSLKPSINYKCHSHLLSLIENMFYESHCEACGFKIQNTFFLRCVECCLDFHVECSPRQLPSTILQKPHQHPLSLRSEKGTEVGSYQLYCSACKKERNLEHPFYCCVECEYVVHVRCAITELRYNDKGRLRHFSHEHILILREIQKNFGASCSGCGEDIEGPTYGCDSCEFYLHKSCAELPKEIYGDHQHYLTLESSEESTGHNDGKRLSCFRYNCHHCKSVDCDWATNHPTNPRSHCTQRKNNDDKKQIGHFSHHHPLIIMEVGDVNCQLCYQGINDRSYGCDPCKFYIHISCSELPQEVRHHFHPLHHLTLRKVKHDNFMCDICLFNIQGFPYQCGKCDFEIHLSCMSLRPSIKYKDHEHLLVLVENTSWNENCEACGFKVNGAFFMRCIECVLNFHVKCGPLPRLPMMILHKQHKHPLMLKTETSFKDDSGLVYCYVCQKERNIKHPIYYCGECEYYAHVRCVITEVQVDEEEKLRHFSHPHVLFLLEDKMREDIICAACEEDVKSDLVYGCNYCKFYIHKSCTKLPKEKHHHLHRHPLTLSYPFPKRYPSYRDPLPPSEHYFIRYNECNACGRDCGGFIYSCKACNFKLGLECVSVYPSIKSEDHEHILTFFEKLSGSLKCQSCMFSPRPYIPSLRCVKCNFNIHLMCSSSLPQTIEHDSHHHSLTFGENCVTLFDRSYDNEYCCDICETRRDARECIYYCQECSFIVDIDCVISKVVDFQRKLGNVEQRIVKKEITQQETRKRSTFGGLVESLTYEEMAIRSGCSERLIHHEELQEFVQQMIDIKHSQHYFLSKAEQCLGDLGLKRDNAHDDQLVNVRNYTTIQKHVQILKNLLDKYGDFGASCALSKRLKTISLVTFCDVVQQMTECGLKDLNKDLILQFWVLLKFVQITGFEVDFAFDFLKTIKSAYLQIDSSTWGNNPLYELNQKIPQLSREIDERNEEIKKLNQKIAQHCCKIDVYNEEIEKLRKQRQDRISCLDSERSRSEAQLFNENLEFILLKRAHGLL